MIPRALFTPRWILAFGLTIGVAAQLPNILGGWYIDSNDWLLLGMGREVATAPSLDHFAGFWTAEPVWRPLLTARVALEWALFGDAYNPRLLVNLVLHVLCALMVFLTVRAWMGRSTPAAWTAVFFFVHPLHGESLAWVHSGTEAITVALPVLITLWAFASHRSLLLALVAFQAALFLGESAVAVPVLISLGAAARAGKGDKLRRMYIDSSPYWAVLLANVAIRAIALSLDGGRDPLGGLQLTADPLAAVMTTAFHPWLPVHPALPGRLWWWLIFASVPFALAANQRLMDTMPLKTAFVAFAALCLPFLPVFHDAHRFLSADPEAWRQHWHYFYLPVAALMLWPAYIISTRDRRRTGWSTMALFALFGLLLTAQALNARWWRAEGQVAREVLDQMDDALADDSVAGVGVVLSGTTGRDLLADEVLLNLPIARPDKVGADHASAVRAYHVIRGKGHKDGTAAVSARDGSFKPQWEEVGMLPKALRWWVWNGFAQRLERIQPAELPLSENKLAFCCRP